MARCSSGAWVRIPLSSIFLFFFLFSWSTCFHVFRSERIICWTYSLFLARTKFSSRPNCFTNMEAGQQRQTTRGRVSVRIKWPNRHMLLHIANYIQAIGPVWVSWQFTMGRYCGDLSFHLANLRYPCFTLSPRSTIPFLPISSTRRSLAY